jgi:hypothetical protein
MGIHVRESQDEEKASDLDLALLTSYASGADDSLFAESIVDSHRDGNLVPGLAALSWLRSCSAMI